MTKTKEAASSPAFSRLLAVAIFGQVIAALGFPITKHGLAEIDPFTFAFYRFLIASIALLAITRLQKQESGIARSDWARIVLLGFLMVILNQFGYLFSQSLTSANHGSILYATTPIWVMLLARLFLKELLFWRRILGIAIAVFGVLVIITGGAFQLGNVYLLGDLLMMIAVLAWSAYIVLGKPMSMKYGAMRVTAYSMGVGALMYFPFGLYHSIHLDYSGIGWGGWGAVLYMGIGMSVASYVTFYWVLKYMDASRLALYSNIQPVIATAVAWLVLGEPITASFLIGAAIVTAGLFTAEW